MLLGPHDSQIASTNVGSAYERAPNPCCGRLSGKDAFAYDGDHDHDHELQKASLATTVPQCLNCLAKGYLLWLCFQQQGGEDVLRVAQDATQGNPLPFRQRSTSDATTVRGLEDCTRGRTARVRK